MAVMEIIVQEKAGLDAVKFYTYPVSYMYRYIYVTCKLCHTFI